MNHYIRHLFLVVFVIVAVSHADKQVVNSYDALGAVHSVDNRMSTTLTQIRNLIPETVASVEADIVSSNRDKIILGLANLFGMIFGVRSAIGDSQRTDGGINQLGFGDQLQVAAQVLYGYGYWGPFLLELEEARLSCGVYDFDSVLAEYGFLTEMASTYGYLNEYSGGNPRNQLTDITEPHVLIYYVTELNHAIKRALYCITSKAGDNQVAKELVALIDLYTSLAEERLSMTNTVMDSLTYNSV